MGDKNVVDLIHCRRGSDIDAAVVVVVLVVVVVVVVVTLPDTVGVLILLL